MRRPPRLVARTLAVTFVTVAVILTIVFIVLIVDARDRVRTAEVETRMLGGEEYASRLLIESGPARIFTLASIDSAARAATRDALMALGSVALGAFVLAAIGSFWLARTLTDPIDTLVRDIELMTATHNPASLLKPTGTSSELDMLAAALDARDPYTAGHSDRVSALSVIIGRQMRLGDTDLEVLRLGALLHDIGKIGLKDEILGKRGALTAEEFGHIKRHPVLGARILRQVPFLEPHLPIVELHHESPDGRGYPFGLRGDDIPLAARIVHVADACDAMTSARAYRPAREPSEACAELQRYSGTPFDPACVDALLRAIPATAFSTASPPLHELLDSQLV